MPSLKRYKSRKTKRTPKRRTPKRRTPKRRTPKRRTPQKKKTPTRKTPSKRILKPCRSDQIRNPKTGRCIKKPNLQPVGKIGIPEHLQDIVLGCAQLDKWTIVKTKTLGTGKVGSVYLACSCKDDSCSCKYAAKMQSLKDGLFMREIEVIEALKGNRYVPTVYSTFICNNMGYIIMEKLVPLTPKTYKGTVDSLVNKVSSYLEKMYNTYHVIFLDIHPGNVMIREETGEVVLIDFGWAIKFETPDDIVTKHPIFKIPGETATIKQLKASQDFNLYMFKKEMSEKWVLVTDSSNLYRLLGVSETANKDEIEQGYYETVLRSTPMTKDHYKKIVDAYDVLYDDDKRKAYDEELAEERKE